MDTVIQNNNRKYLRVVNIFAYIAMVAINILSETQKFNGVTSADVSDRYASFFTPAGFTFAIWFVIYLGLGYFAVWQAVTNRGDLLDKIGLNFAITCALNIAWLILWHYNMIYISTVIIIALLIMLYDIRKTVWQDSEEAQSSCNSDMCTIGTKAGKTSWIVRSTFSIYNAWILIASIASLFIIAGALFEKFAFSTFAKVLVYVVVLCAAISAYMHIRKNKDYAWALTIAWAVAGIAVSMFAS